MKGQNNERVLVLGAASWLGYLLLNEMHLKIPDVHLAGSLHRQRVSFNINVELYYLHSLDELQLILKGFNPTVIVNFLRGEDEQGMSFHKDIIEYSKAYGTHYIYASSALALDGYRNENFLTETTLANSISPYGIFKGECEKLLYNTNISWTILRFASVQGWVPHKITRNTNLLLKLSEGKEITVDRGVVQNRMIADDVIRGLRKLIKLRTQGIIHFGTTDCSEEFHFLQKQASLFGYSPRSIKSGKVRNVNLNVAPDRIFSILGDEFRYTEQQTLDQLLRFPSLTNLSNPNKYQL